MRESAAQPFVQFDPVAVKRFVREVLGCHCPEEVFNHIEVRRCNPAGKGSPQAYEINIGDRLLIQVTSAPTITSRGLATIIQEGRAIRDTRGFNRFRLVVLTDKLNEVEPTLSQEFQKLPSKDEKIHLHIISRTDFPELFAQLS